MEHTRIFFKKDKQTKNFKKETFFWLFKTCLKPDEASKSLSPVFIVRWLLCLLLYFHFFLHCFYFIYPLNAEFTGDLKFQTNHSWEETVEMSPSFSLWHQGPQLCLPHFTTFLIQRTKKRRRWSAAALDWYKLTTDEEQWLVFVLWCLWFWSYAQSLDPSKGGS